MVIVLKVLFLFLCISGIQACKQEIERTEKEVACNVHTIRIQISTFFFYLGGREEKKKTSFLGKASVELCLEF